MTSAVTPPSGRGTEDLHAGGETTCVARNAIPTICRRPGPHRASVIRGLVVTAIMLITFLAISNSAQGEAGPGISQLSGRDGCVAQPQEQTEGCASGNGLAGATDVAVSADGAHVYTTAADSAAVAFFGRDGDNGALTQVGCVSYNGTAGYDGTDGACADGAALTGATALAISPDGRNLYAAARRSGGLAVFARDPSSGAVAQLQCLRNFIACDLVYSLAGASSVAVSPDGAHVYATAGTDGAVTVFARDANGRLTPVSCVSDDGTDGHCTDVKALRGASDVVVSADGRFVYATAAQSSSVVTFARNVATGGLTQVECTLEFAPPGGPCAGANGIQDAVALALSADGRNLYVVGEGFAVFARDETTGALRQAQCILDDFDDEPGDGCSGSPSLLAPADVAESPDRRRVYVAHDFGLTVFARTPSGFVDEIGCFEEEFFFEDEEGDEDEETPTCAVGRGVDGASGVAASPDGRNIYLASRSASAVAVFGPGTAIADHSRATRAGIARVSLRCPRARTSPCSGRLTLTGTRRIRSLSGSRTFVLLPGRRGRIAVLLSSRAQRMLARRGRLQALAIATDRTGRTHPVRRIVIVSLQRPARLTEPDPTSG